MHRGVKTAALMPPTSQRNPALLEQQVSDVGHEREILRVQIVQRDKEITSLRHELEQQSAEMGRMKSAENQLEADLQTRQAGRQDLLQQRSDLSQKLEVCGSQNSRTAGQAGFARTSVFPGQTARDCARSEGERPHGSLT